MKYLLDAFQSLSGTLFAQLWFCGEAKTRSIKNGKF